MFKQAQTAPPAFWQEPELWEHRAEPAVRAELVDRFLAFAKSIAIRYSGPAESTDDLVQVASLGLMNAIERFDPENGSPFIAFASATINGELKRHFRDRVSGIRLPRDLYERVGQFERAVSSLRGDLAREPTVPEMAEAMGCSGDQILEVKDAIGARHPISFAREDSETADGVLEDHLGREDAEFEHCETRIFTEEMLSDLEGWDLLLINLRFREQLSQSQIADQLGCSQMHVSRNLRRILESLNHKLVGNTD